jgi:hypothetical protein
MIPKSKKVFVVERKIDGQFCRLEISRQYDQGERKYYNLAVHIGPNKVMVRKKPSYLSSRPRGKSMQALTMFVYPLTARFVNDYMKPGDKMLIHFVYPRIRKAIVGPMKKLGFNDESNFLRYVKQENEVRDAQFRRFLQRGRRYHLSRHAR